MPPPTRRPLAAITGNSLITNFLQPTPTPTPAPAKKRPADDDADAPPPKKIKQQASAAPVVDKAVAAATQSKAARELAVVTPEQARATLARLINGFQDKSGASYPAAVRNEAGCILAQKVPNRQDNGYVQIAAVVLQRTRVSKGSPPKPKPAPQNAHRLVVVAHKSQDEIDRLLAGEHASHRCGNSTCINPNHIVVEPQPDNEGRKGCKTRGPIIVTEHNGEELTLPPGGECTCNPKCILMIERRKVAATKNIIS